MYMIRIAFLCVLITYLNAQFIRQHGLLKLYEFTVNNKYNNLPRIQPFGYLIDDKCNNQLNKIEDRSANIQMKASNLNAEIGLYQSHNFNLRFMLLISFDSPTDESDVDGYEIRITDNFNRNATCIRIVKDSLSNKNEKKYNIKIKDPNNLADPTNKNHFLYFGKITVTSLKYCDSSKSNIDDLCVLTNTNTLPVEVAITSNQTERTKSLNSQKECIKSPLVCTCAEVVTDDNRYFAIVTYKFPWYVGVIENRMAWRRLPPFYSYPNETINDYIFKIHEIEDFVRLTYPFSNVYYEKSESNECSEEEFCREDNSSLCLECDTTQSQSIHITNGNGKYKKVKRCSLYPHTSLLFDTKTFFINMQAKVINEESDTYDGYHLIDRQPVLCMSFHKKTRIVFDQSETIYQLKLNFNDSNLISKSSLFEIDYKIRLYVICYDKHSNKNVTNDTTNPHVYGSIEKSIDFVESHQDVYFNDLQEGNYAIEVVPHVKSIECGILCPFITDSNSRKFSCEQCKKLVYFFEISSNNKNETTCLNTISNRVAKELSYDIEKMLAIHNETLLVSIESDITYPSRLLNSLKCPAGIKSSNTNMTLLLVIVVGALVLFFIVIFIISCFINAHNYYSNLINHTPITLYSTHNLTDIEDDILNCVETTFKQTERISPMAGSKDINIKGSDVIVILVNSKYELIEYLKLCKDGFGALKIGKSKHDDSLNCLFLNLNKQKHKAILATHAEIDRDSIDGFDEYRYFLLGKEKVEFLNEIVRIAGQSLKKRCFYRASKAFVEWFMRIQLKLSASLYHK